MYTQIDKPKENKGRTAANSAVQKQSDVKQCFDFIDNRTNFVTQRRTQKMVSSSPRTKQPKDIQNNDHERDRETTHVTQCVLVAQLATRQSSPVQFQGSANELRDLIYRWNHLPGIQVQVQQTDYVGGTFTVRFTRDNGAISLQQANTWVQNALAHAQQSDSDSDDSDSEE